MQRTNLLLSHFEEWQKQHFSSEVFYHDGIINEEEFDKAKIKLLFIAKEPNASNHKGDGLIRSFINEWNNEKPDYVFAQRIADWSYGILNDFPEFSKITKEDRYQYLRKIAFINLKKSGGVGSLSKVKEFHELVEVQKSLITDQINIIRPDIVILSLSHSEYLRELLFPETKKKWRDSGYDIKIARSGNTKLIDFYHPSSRNVAPAAYSLLQNIIRSDSFKAL